MALSNYTELQASVAAWLNRSDLTGVIPDFIAIAESAISRDLRLRKQIVSSTLTTTAGVRGVNLPSDWLEFENVSVATSPERQLSYATVEQMELLYPDYGGETRSPSLYTIEGDQIMFGPTPDAAYTVNILYYARFAALSTASTNWLLTNHPSVYLYAALEQACLYCKDADGAARYKALYEADVQMLNKQDDMAQHSGSMLRVRVK